MQGTVACGLSLRPIIENRGTRSDTMFTAAGVKGVVRAIAWTVMVIVPISLFVGGQAQEPAAPTSEENDTRIYVCQPDGSGMKLLVEKTEYRMQGSPTWSADGKVIAFDAWRPGVDPDFT